MAMPEFKSEGRLDLASLGLPHGLPPGALGERQQPTIERLYGLMGERLAFATNDLRLLAAADQAFGRYALPSRRSEPLSFHLFVDDAERYPALGHVPGTWSTGAPIAPIMRTRGHLVYVTLGEGNTVVADLTHGAAFGFVTDALADEQAMVRYYLLQGIALSMLQACHGYLGLHAACVRKEGMTLIINGDAGAGKSTTAYACVRRGYQLVSEDGLCVQVESDSLRVWGMPWMLHLLPDSARFFPELAGETPVMQLNGEWKLAVDVQSRWPRSALTDAEPGLVVFLDRTAELAEPEIARVPLHEALGAFGLVWPWQVGWTDALADGLVRLLEGRAFRVRVGGPPDAVVDALDTLRVRVANSGPSTLSANEHADCTKE